MQTLRVLRVGTRFATYGTLDPSRCHLYPPPWICWSSAPRSHNFSRTDNVGSLYHLRNTFLYRKVPTPNRTTITMGMGYRNVSTATQIIPTVRVFEKSIERMEPTISAGMICSVSVKLLPFLSGLFLGICLDDFLVFRLTDKIIMAIFRRYFQDSFLQQYGQYKSG
jgi:hypothetical protein